MTIALTRPVPASIAHCELTHLAREPIDLRRARAQHAAYERALAEAGCTIERLPAEDVMADSVFVEDAAIVVDELAIITRPGAESRRGETLSVARAVAAYRPLAHIREPATVDGGDVLRVGRDVYVGISTRTNDAAVGQLTSLLAPHGYRVHGVAIAGVLHLKSAATEAGDGVVLVNPRWIEPSLFTRTIAVDPDEPYGANVLRVNDTLFAAAAFPRTNDRLREAGFTVRTLEADELAKAEGALTCCSVLVLPFRA
jgi:dimethylargininase